LDHAESIDETKTTFRLRPSKNTAVIALARLRESGRGEGKRAGLEAVAWKMAGCRLGGGFFGDWGLSL
jgi:hypothetical protein